MDDQKNLIHRFDRFRIDAGKRLLFAEDEIVTLTPKAFDTLLALVENSPGVLSKEDLMRLVWPDQFVEENNLAQNIHAIRKALRDAGARVEFIETIPKRGYRFVTDTKSAPDETDRDLRTLARPRQKAAALYRNAVAAAGPPPSAGDRSYAPAIPKTHYVVSTGDVNIAYQVIGDGPIDLVFVMGWVSHLEYFWQEPSFARFLTRLASFSRLILFDKRGTGLSDRVPLSNLPSLEQRMTDVQAVMDAVGSERAALLGVSEGGPMCSLFAATYPERTLALVMIGTYAKRIRSSSYPWAPTREAQAGFLEEIKRNWGGPVGLEDRAPSAAEDPQFREWWSAYLRLGASPGAALALTRMNAEIDIRNVLPSIRVPTLVMHRAGDILLPVEGGRYVASRIPGARYVELEGDDHLPFVGHQDQILDEVEEFLTGMRSEHEIDRVLVTVLFVLFDAATSDAQAGAIRTLQTHMERELALFRGKAVEMTGARLFATFDGPARAIRCARAIARVAERLGVRVRAGLHTGECDAQGEKMGGVTVMVGEAVARLADPSEVLVSHTVKDLVAGSGIEFEAREAESFDNLPGEWRLLAVRRDAA